MIIGNWLAKIFEYRGIGNFQGKRVEFREFAGKTPRDYSTRYERKAQKRLRENDHGLRDEYSRGKVKKGFDHPATVGFCREKQLAIGNFNKKKNRYVREFSSGGPEV